MDKSIGPNFEVLDQFSKIDICQPENLRIPGPLSKRHRELIRKSMRKKEKLYIYQVPLGETIDFFK